MLCYVYFISCWVPFDSHNSQHSLFLYLSYMQVFFSLIFSLILRPAYLLLMEGIYTTAIAIFLAVRQNLSLARQEELWDTWARHSQKRMEKGRVKLKPKQWKEKSETGQTCAEHAEISQVKDLQTMDQWISNICSKRWNFHEIFAMIGMPTGNFIPASATCLRVMWTSWEAASLMVVVTWCPGEGHQKILEAWETQGKWHWKASGCWMLFKMSVLVLRNCLRMCEITCADTILWFVLFPDCAWLQFQSQVLNSLLWTRMCPSCTQLSASLLLSLFFVSAFLAWIYQ